MENNENKTENPDLEPEVQETEAPQPVDNTDIADNPEVRKLIEEAEHRGYLRGRNENIEGFIAKNFDDEPFVCDDDCISEPCPAFLSHVRPGFWE